ncbi:hypothetical protein THRCLA_07812 [Thraustotheca clavata]|uniref:Uncharacterized protein n=1 Tax=Thraustotheca clavata TaxID=74557 RepID=A0A1V9ZBY2_9STRA|nr:hypothetical protein THRCLA_07812 [Thraustotheca clavata]
MGEESKEVVVPVSRGKCLYKTGKCQNERALKTNGQPHNLCDMHRLRQNQNQRKLDGKNRHNRTHATTSTYSTYPPPVRASPDRTYIAPQPHGDYTNPTYMYPTALPPMAYPPSPHYALAPKIEADDDITVRTPSYLKGEAREAFRSRVLQKLVNIISEEVMTTPVYQEVPKGQQYGYPPQNITPMHHPGAYDRQVYAYPPPLEPRPYGTSIFQQNTSSFIKHPPPSLPPLTQCIGKETTKNGSPTVSPVRE